MYGQHGTLRLAGAVVESFHQIEVLAISLAETG